VPTAEHHRAATKPRASLKDELVRAASQLFAADGYDGLSMRRVAQAIGCSQMAMYRHFANKESLVQHLCAGLYVQFAERMHREMGDHIDPRMRLRRFIRAVLQFAESFPDHYSLIFLMRHSDPDVIREREALGQQFLEGIAEVVQQALPSGATTHQAKITLRRMMEMLHGTAALRIAHPDAYGVTPQRAQADVEAVWMALLDARE